MQVDFCVALNGINLDLMVPLFFETLFRNVTLTNLHIHVVEHRVGDRIHEYLVSKKESCPVPFDIHILDEFFSVKIGPSEEVIDYFAADTAKRCEWMMKNCGNNKWAIISHFDLVFRKDTMQDCIPRLTDEYGLVGQHNQGMVAINRRAYDQCSVGFENMSYYYAIKDGPRNQYKLRFGADPRCNDQSIRIEGFDVSELLELNIWYKKWAVLPMRFAGFDHIVAGSGYHANDGIAKNQRGRMTNYLKLFGVKPISAG